MNNTFFVGVYPGIDDARLDYMIVGRSSASWPAESASPRAIAGERMPVAQKLGCVVDEVVDHGERVYTVSSAGAPGAAISRRPVPPPRARSLRRRPASGPSRGCSRSPARQTNAKPCASPTRSRAVYRADGARARRGSRRLGQDAVRRVHGGRGSDVVLFAGGTGITAFTAFLAGLTTDTDQSVTLAYGARTVSLLIYRDARGALRPPAADRSMCCISSNSPTPAIRWRSTRAECRSTSCGRGCDSRSTRPTTFPGRRRCCGPSPRTFAPVTSRRRRSTLTPGNSGAATAPTFWRDRPVFVTGATGLLGGWLVRQLVAAGADVVGLVRDWVPRSELVASRLIDRIAVVRGDVRDQETLERALGEHEIVDCLPPRRAGHRRRGEPQSGIDARHEHSRHVGAPRGLPAHARRSNRSSSLRPTRPTALRTCCPTPRIRRCSAGILTTSASPARICWRRCTPRASACPSVSHAAATSLAAAI